MHHDRMQALADMAGLEFDHSNDLGMGKGEPPKDGRVGSRESDYALLYKWLDQVTRSTAKAMDWPAALATLLTTCRWPLWVSKATQSA